MNLLFLIKLYKEDRIVCLKNMLLYVFQQFNLREMKIHIFFSIFSSIIIHNNFPDLSNISISITDRDVTFIFGYFCGLFIIKFISIYFFNSRGFKRWNYGIDKKTNKKHKLVEPNPVYINYTEWENENYDVNGSFFKNLLENEFDEFLGLDLTKKYMKDKYREDSINKLI